MSDASARLPRRYTRLQVGLHWLVVGLLALQFLVNHDIRTAFRTRLAGQQELIPAALLAGLHIATGCLILGLMLLRFRLRLQAKPRPPAGQVPDWLHVTAKSAHLLLYAVTIGMAIAGLWAWVWASPLAATLHESGRLLLILLLFAHVAGALIEHHLLANPVLHAIIGAEMPPADADAQAYAREAPLSEAQVETSNRCPPAPSATGGA